MYKTVILGKELVISNKAYEALVRKWRVGNITDNVINGDCSYCGKYLKIMKCNPKCPYEKFQTKIHSGCKVILLQLTKDNFPFSFRISYAIWDTKEKAIACVSAVEEELKKFEKVK
jgi:hypothetical protein